LNTIPKVATVNRAYTTDFVHLGYGVALLENLETKAESFEFYPQSFFKEKKQIQDDFLERKITLRSTAKPSQILACLDLGLDFSSSKELAIALSSHSGSKIHTDLLQNLIEKFAINYQDLKCGIHEPLGRETQQSQDPKIRVLQNNCAGKHLAMIKTCLINNWDYQNGKYLEFEHPLQQKIKEKIKELSETKEKVLVELDTCQSPCYTLKVKELLRLFSNLNNYQNLKEAFYKNSFLISGRERIDHVISELYAHNLIIKSGSGGLTVLSFQKKQANKQKLRVTLLVKLFDSSEQIRALFIEKILDLYLINQKTNYKKAKLLETEFYDWSNQHKLSEIKINN